MTVRLIDVARRAGVSIATASRSISGRDGVSPEVAARVVQIADTMGFVPNAHARSLAGGATASIGLIVGAIDDPYFSEIAAGVIRRAEADARSVEIAHAGSAHELAAQIRVFRSHNLGVILLALSGLVDPRDEAEVAFEVAAFTAVGGRVAAIGHRSFPIPTVLPGNREGGRLIGEHLRDLGHRAIAVVAGPANSTTVADRLAGLREALGEGEIRSVTFHDFSRQGGIDGAGAALGATPPVTAIAALSDVLAIGVLSQLRSRRIRVPSQVVVTGFDDVSVAGDLAPSLTTVRINLGALGSELLQLADAAPDAPGSTIRPPIQLIVRNSTGAG